MRILLVHQNFPGQFKHLAPALIARGDAVEGTLTAADLAHGFRLGNALRGLMPARLAL